MGTGQPYMYAPESRFSSSTTFDPRAVSRASWQPAPQRPKQNGPLVSFNQHPDSHMALKPRTTVFAPLGRRTKGAITWLRRLQLFIRLLELNGAIGIMVLMILFDNVEPTMAWIMRIAPGIFALHLGYSIYHHARPATGRTPGSSASYQVFAAVFDLVTLAIYAYGAFSVHQQSKDWTTRLADQTLLSYFVPAVYYTLVGAGGLHVISLLISIWLGWMFQKISTMPPDMNPLEDNLTARPMHKHKRNKSSIATTSTAYTEKRLSTPSDTKSRSSMIYEQVGAGPRVPFMHTRTNSIDSFNSRDSRVNLPNRQYQIASNNSPRMSTASLASSRTFMPFAATRGQYAEVPLNDARQTNRASVPNNNNNNNNNSRDRLPKFTEAWKPTDSLVSRTNQRGFDVATAAQNTRASKAYSAVSQRYNGEESDSDYGNEDAMPSPPKRNNVVTTPNKQHPNPLRSNPTSPSSQAGTPPQRPWTAATLAANSALTEISNNDRLVHATRNLVKPASMGQLNQPRRDSSIQSDALFSSAYGKPNNTSSSPVTVGNNRKISSGNDWEAVYRGAERRRVSGKVAEEGLAGQKYGQAF